METFQYGLKVTDKDLGSGISTGRTWHTIVKALVDSGEIYLGEGESIDAIRIDMNYGLYFHIKSALVIAGA